VSPINQPFRLLTRSFDGWRWVLAPGPLWVVRVAFLVVGLLLLAHMLPRLRGWPKGPSRLAPLAWDSTHFAPVVGIDFFAIYEAGVQLGSGGDPYMVDGDRIHQIGGPLKAPYVATYRYLPITTWWLAWPLGLLPPWTALQFWTGLNLLLVLWGAGITAHLARSRGAGPLAGVAVVLPWLCWCPLMVEWHMGQFSFFMAMLMFAAALPWAATPRGTDDPAPSLPPLVPWAFSVALKNFSALWWPLWFGAWMRARCTGQDSVSAWRALVFATLVPLLVVITSVGYFATYPERYERFQGSATESRVLGTAPYHFYWGRQGVGLLFAVTEAMPALARLPVGDGPRDMTAYLAREIPSSWSKPLTLVLALSLGGWAALALWRAGRHGRGALEAVALAWLWWFFTYVDCWEHHYSMLLPLWALLAATGRLPLPIAAIAALAWGAPSLWYFCAQAADPVSWWSQHPAAKAVLYWCYFAQRPLGCLLVTGWIVRGQWTAWRSHA